MQNDITGLEEGLGLDLLDFAKFSALITLVANRIKRYLWSPRHDLFEHRKSWSKCDVFQLACAVLLTLHAAGTAAGFPADANEQRANDGLVLLIPWIGCTLLLTLESCKCLGRSPELKIFWMLDLAFRMNNLRTAVLDLARDQAGAGTALFWWISSTLVAVGISAAGLMQTNSVPPEFLEKAYGKMSDDDTTEPEKAHRVQEQRSWASLATFSWINQTLNQALVGKIEEEKLRSLRPQDLSAEKRDALLAAWQEQQRCYAEKSKLWKALVFVFALDFVKAACLKLVEMVFAFVGPLLLQQLLASIEPKDITNPSPGAEDFDLVKVDGIMLAFAISLCAFTKTFVHEQWVVRFIATNVQIRGSLVGMIFRKAFVLSAKGRQRFKVGVLISLMSVDANRIGHSMHGLHTIWSIPIYMVVSTAMLHRLVGNAIFIGLLVPLILFPIQYCLIRTSAKLNKDVMKIKDERSNLMDEVVQGIRIIKYFAWESNFESKVQEIRAREISLLRRIVVCNTAIHTMSEAVTMLIALVTVAAYTLNGTELKPSVAFGALALFKLLEIPFRSIGHMVDMVIEAKTALDRLGDFFKADEIDRHFYLNSGEALVGAGNDSVEMARTDAPGAVIVIAGGKFSWPQKDDQDAGEGETDAKLSIFESFSSLFNLKSSRSLEMEMKETRQGAEVEMHEVLKEIDIEVKSGQLCMVTGKVGAGKTSLLAAILGEAHKDCGGVTLNGKVAYAPQQPWIFNATVKENVLFGSEFNQERYDTVLRVCALEPDIAILPAGDKTEIGEKGVNLSGGQKARICLARAVYQDADVYIFDDPLSAVDVHVSKTMFHDCICSFLAGKTRVLVTHQVQYLRDADLVVHLDGGSVAAQGAPELVMAQVPHLADPGGRCERSEEARSEGDRSPRRLSDSSGADTKESPRQAAPPGSGANEGGKSVLAKSDGAQTTEEEMLQDSVDLDIWKKYAITLGTGAVVAYFAVLVLNEILAVAGSWWLSVWSTATSDAGTPDLVEGETVEEADHAATSAGAMFYILLFALINVAKCVVLAVLLLIERFAGMRAATKLHNQMLAVVLRTPVEFFDVTPSGRILNRFTSDVNQLDGNVSGSLNSFVGHLVEAVVLCSAIALVNPWALIVAVPSMGIFVSIQRLFKRGCLQLQRLESITKSPIFAHFSESLNGVATIRAFGAHRRAMATACSLHDRLARAWLNLIDCHQWLTIRITSVTNFVVLATSVAAVLGSSPSAASAAAAGLVITYAMQLTGVLQETVRSFTRSEQALVSVERVVEYGSMEQEGSSVLPASPPPQWPSRGQLEFKAVEMTYRAGLPAALRGLSFSTLAGEKIGVVGRTGAGKSSLAVALFRLARITAGGVSLDGVDLATVGIEELRRRLSIIPQDPVLFSGSIRSNLDPFGQHSDGELWAALECVHMSELVAGFRAGLEQQVAQGGSNLSIGQRQLFCLARALLRKAKVIVMDEATASVDLQTDALIQDTMRSQFRQSTVLTIAHRLSTVLSCDRVMVLGEGRVLEIGAPSLLADDPASIFHSMVADPKAEEEWLG